MVGDRGQFDVLVDGAVVISKNRPGLMGRLLGDKGFPDEGEAVAAVAAKLRAT